jgi:TRAP-type C4-dicarboxylate transport system substrate-binding protein
MKRWRECSFLLTLVVAALAPAQTTTLKLATLAPDRSLWHQAIQQMASDWRKATSGRVSLTVFAGTMGDEPTIVRKMRLNQLQAASLTSTGLIAVDQAFSVFGIPLFYDSYEELMHVVDRLTPTLAARIEAKGFVLVGWGNAGWVHVFSKARIESLEDLRRAKLFTTVGEEVMRQWYLKNGFSPVALAPTDMLTSLETGMIDAIPSTPLAALAFQWYQQTPFMLDIKLGPLVGATIITARAWNGIGEADRKVLREHAGRLDQRLRLEVPKQDAESIAEMEKRGLTVVRVAGTDKGATFQEQARQYAQAMRSELVPDDIFDLAVRERDAYRAQRDRDAKSEAKPHAKPDRGDKNDKK